MVSIDHPVGIRASKFVDVPDASTSTLNDLNGCLMKQQFPK